MSIIDTSRKRKKRRQRKCRKCGKTGRLERHHVTYEPPQISNLCRKCHKLITELNTMCSQSTRPFHKLENEERVILWKAFLAR
jgi:hypothetical protein